MSKNNKKNKNKNKNSNQNNNQPVPVKEVEQPSIIVDSIETFEEKFTIKDFEEKKAFLLEFEKNMQQNNADLQKDLILFANKEKEFIAKISEINVKYAIADEDVANYKQEKLNTVNVEITNIKLEKLEQLNADFEKERQIKTSVIDNELNAKKEKLVEEENNFLQQKIEFEKTKKEFDIKYNTFELDSLILKEKMQSNEIFIKERIEAGIRDERETLVIELDSKNEALEQLRNSQKQYSLQLEKYKNIYAQLGQDPVFILNKINSLEEENSNLKNELANSPTKELQQKYDFLQKEYEGIELKFNDLTSMYENKCKELNDNEFYRLKYETANQHLIHEQSKAKEYEAQTQNLQARIDRLTGNSGSNIDREALIHDISRPVIKFNNEDNIYEAVGTQPPSEIMWLDSITDRCEDYGIVFPQRILYAFHTALKISDWSQIAILAGVSGTGKSELPKLYSAFGGINFISVAVKPNWDSPDDMLGFFNSIDNKFDPEPLLRFLVQSSTDLKDYLSIVLLDEMNLSHVENYFSDFLSKLEERRGKLNIDLPELEIKIGAGIEPYPLKLRRNIMWTGTMNQDETTKSISDKVKDRGIIINFPRPKVLKRRTSMQPLKKNETLLKYETWAGTLSKPGWVKRKLNFSEEQFKQLDHYKKIVEKINSYIPYENGALAHRTWNQIEFYIANYPTVSELVEIDEELTDELKEAMHIAFEDQIVQKIMPKLRGVETHSVNMTNCFEKIIKLLEEEGFNLTKDIQNACEAGFGSFIWCSSEYLEED